VIIVAHLADDHHTKKSLEIIQLLLFYSNCLKTLNFSNLLCLCNLV